MSGVTGSSLYNYANYIPACARKITNGIPSINKYVVASHVLDDGSVSLLFFFFSFCCNLINETNKISKDFVHTSCISIYLYKCVNLKSHQLMKFWLLYACCAYDIYISVYQLFSVEMHCNVKLCQRWRMIVNNPLR